MNITDSEPYQDSNLWLQILQLKNFLVFIGGGAVLFIPFYIQNDPSQWSRALPLFMGWVILIIIWFLAILLMYTKYELKKRFFSYIASLFKWIAPIVIICSGLYLVLFPFEFRKTLGIMILIVLVTLKSNKGASKMLSNSTTKTGRKLQVKNDTPRQAANWVATETNNEQGTDYREIDLQGDSVKTLNFRVRPSSTFWRAGFKITNPQGTILPLRTDKSLLFHVGSSESRNKFGITAYRNGKWISSVNKLVDFDIESFISIKFEFNGRSITCSINDNVELKYREADYQIPNKLFLCAWGDGNPYRVEFVDIEYLIQS